MSTDLDNILVFKTNILTADDKLIVGPILAGHMLVHEWSVDQDDKDCVLRIISSELNYPDIIAIINNCGYHCEELQD
jgi:hypothetical protein